MGKRKSGLIGERESVNPVQLQRRQEKEQQRKRGKEGRLRHDADRSSHGTGRSDSSKDVESRAKAWKDAQQRLSGGFRSIETNVEGMGVHLEDADVPASARYSLYYDAMSNPSGAPPANKPAAYRHPNGVIRDHPPAVSESGCSSSDYSSSGESTPSESASIPAKVADVASVSVGSAPQRPPAPLPVKRPPPPRPVTGLNRPAHLPLLIPDLVSPVAPMEVAAIPKELPVASEEAISSLPLISEDVVTNSSRVFSEHVVISSQPVVVKPALFAPSSIRRK